MQYLGNGQYQIKNSQTGQTKVVGESDLPTYGLSAPQPQPNFLKQVANGLHGVASFFQPGITKTIETMPGHMNDYQSKLPNTKGNIGQSIQNAANMTGEAAKNAFNPGLISDVGGDAATSFFAPRILAKFPQLAKFLANPMAHQGKLVEDAVTKSTNPLLDLITQHLGSADNPNPNLLRNTGLDQTAAKQAASDYIKQLFSHASGNTLEGFGDAVTKAPNASDILSARGNAYTQGYDSGGNTITKNLGRNFGKAYTDILHSGVPETKGPDRVLSLLHKVDHPIIKQGLPYAAAGALGGGALNWLRGLFSNN